MEFLLFISRQRTLLLLHAGYHSDIQPLFEELQESSETWAGSAYTMSSVWGFYAHIWHGQFFFIQIDWAKITPQRSHQGLFLVHYLNQPTSFQLTIVASSLNLSLPEIIAHIYLLLSFLCLSKIISTEEGIICAIHHHMPDVQVQKMLYK